MALPAVMLIVAIAIGSVSLQLKRIDLVSSASILARAIAREEPSEVVDQMVDSLGNLVHFELQEQNGLVCVQLVENVQIAGLEVKIFELSERQCARAVGQ